MCHCQQYKTPQLKCVHCGEKLTMGERFLIRCSRMIVCDVCDKDFYIAHTKDGCAPIKIT
jgi:hypothetical protein